MSKYLRPLNKKGDVTDIPLFMVLLFYLAVAFIVVIYANDIMKTEVVDDPSMNSSATATISAAFNTINTVTVQRGFALMAAILIIGIIASSFIVRIHPAFIFLHIFVLAFCIFVAVFLANVYGRIIAVDEFVAIAGYQTMITYFMKNLVSVILGVGGLSMIITFSKIFSKGGQGGGDRDIIT